LPRLLSLLAAHTTTKHATAFAQPRPLHSELWALAQLKMPAKQRLARLINDMDQVRGKVRILAPAGRAAWCWFWSNHTHNNNTDRQAGLRSHTRSN